MLGPVVVTLSALSLSVLCRSMEWISSIAKNPSPKGYMKDLKPVMKNVYTIMERIFGGTNALHEITIYDYLTNGCN